MIVTFTDFGTEGPYLGQVRAVLHAGAPDQHVVDLMNDVPKFDIQGAAYLLSAAMQPLPPGTVCLGVIDPGVGSARRAVILEADGRWYVGPGNGLFEIVAKFTARPRWWEISWRPKYLSASFHGRDLFAPVAAGIAVGLAADPAYAPDEWGVPSQPGRSVESDWPNDWPAVIYIDGYGNCMTGVRWSSVAPEPIVEAGGIELPIARIFADVSAGAVFCYENALGLLEIAANRENASETLGLSVGSQVSVRNL